MLKSCHSWICFEVLHTYKFFICITFAILYQSILIMFTNSYNPSFYPFFKPYPYLTIFSWIYTLLESYLYIGDFSLIHCHHSSPLSFVSLAFAYSGRLLCSSLLSSFLFLFGCEKKDLGIVELTFCLYGFCVSLKSF